MALTWLGFFAAVFFAYYYYLKFRSQERMKLIEKNVDLSEIYKKKRNWQNLPWFIISFVLLDIGIGAIVGLYLISDKNLLGNTGPFAFFATIFIFGAVGILVGHFLEKKRK